MVAKEIENAESFRDEDFIGAGRSGRVYRLETEEGTIARKVFGGDTLSKLIHYIFFGAPNPYIWNESAIRCAFYRRRILRELFAFWFAARLRIADAVGFGWSDDAKAFYLDTEFSPGRPISLVLPFATEGKSEFDDLTDQIMKPLQAHLICCGFDGAVWQAGKGNPVALNNFLLLDEGDETRTFAFIDPESGVPALFALNPPDLFGYYLPRCMHFGRALFDDTDVPKLRQYVDDNRSAITDEIGIENFEQLLDNIAHLQHHQELWKGMRRVDRSIQYQLSQGRINEKQARWYSRHPVRWYAREIGRYIPKIARKLFISIPRRIYDWLRSIDFRAAARNTWSFFTSSDFRARIASVYIRGRILAWMHRDQMDRETGKRLRTELRRDRTSRYLTDFGVHLGIKIGIPVIELTVFLILYAFGVIGAGVFVLLFLFDGPIFRSLYTGTVFLRAAKTGEPMPWVALVVGLVPFFGTVAFPAQMIASARGRDARVAQFTVADSFTRFGRRIPIWGGEDTRTEHFWNRLALKILS